MRQRLPLLFLVVGVMAAPLARAARADDLKISAVAGIGGRYRPGGWVPVTLSIVNPGPDALHGQVQVFGPDSDAVYARPADVGPGPHTFQVYTRGLNPSREAVVARLVAGPERGDGGTLAQTSSFPTSGPSGFSGLPVSGRDLLLISLSADPAAFGTLNGQKWGLTHTAAGPVPERTPPPNSGPGTSAAVQVAAASPADLPDRPAGYDGVDAVLLRGDAPLDSLDEAQADALKAWVAAGGHLVVCGGADPVPYANSFYAGLLPAAVGPAGAAPRLTLTPKPLPGVRVLLRDSQGRPAVVTGLYGAGVVTVTAFDPTKTPTGPWPATFWKLALTDRSSLLGAVAAREAHEEGVWYGGQLADAVLRAPSLDAPGAGVVGLFLLGYVLVLVPVNYLVLKRLDKKEWAWGTIPALVLVFAAATYAAGYAAKGGGLFVNRAAIVEAAAGQRQAGLYAEVGLFSPHRTAYDLLVADPNALAAIPQPQDEYAHYSYGGRRPDTTYGQARFVQRPGDAQVQDAAVNMWAMRAFDVQTTTDLGGAITSTLALSPQTGRLRGSIANGTPHALRECHLYLNGQWQPVSDLPPGAALPVAATAVPTGSATGLGRVSAQQWAHMPGIVGRSDADDPQSDVRQRMRAALANFARDLGSDPTNGQYYGGNYGPPAAFTPRPGEALLTGWCDDATLAGPPVRVDGRPAAQNNVTFVVIHLPLR